MIVVDTSAIVSIMRGEAEAQNLSQILQDSGAPAISAGSLLELGIVLLHKREKSTISELYRFLEVAGVEVVPVSEINARDAIEAYARFGKASRHPAQLNYGDCFAYALAKSLDAPLLYKGEDFSRTDIRSAL